MTSAALELQAAIRALLIADPQILATLGGPRVHDGVPRDQSAPCVALDEIVSRRRDGLNAVLEEHRLVLRVWSKSGGKAEAMRLAAGIVTLLDDAAPTLPTHRVIRLAPEASDIKLSRDRTAAEATLRFLILTQPLN